MYPKSDSKLLKGRHRRAVDNHDHARRTHVPAPADADIERRLDELVKPAVFGELAHYRQLGLRNRLLTLPVMVAVVLAMLWRRIPGVSSLQRLLAQERILWTQPTRVSQPALSERFLTFPAELFERVLQAVLAQLPQRAAHRTRPVPLILQGLQTRFATCYALDATTWEALFRKLKALQDEPEARLAGQLAVVFDVVSHRPPDGLSSLTEIRLALDGLAPELVGSLYHECLLPTQAANLTMRSELQPMTLRECIAPTMRACHVGARAMHSHQCPFLRGSGGEVERERSPMVCRGMHRPYKT
jgi:hypothetical protein